MKAGKLLMPWCTVKPHEQLHIQSTAKPQGLSKFKASQLVPVH